MSEKEFIPIWAREPIPSENPVEYKKAVLMRRKIGSDEWELILDKNGEPITQFMRADDKNVRSK